MDTEEFLDIHFYRPLGYAWAIAFRKWGVHPNSVTLAAILLGIAAGICFYFRDLRVNIPGMLLLVWANTYDSADGQLARMTRRTSPLGRMLDGFCGQAWFVTIYAAICLRLTPEWGLWIWLLGAITGYGHSRQAALADYYRNLHLLFLKGKAGSELSDSATLRIEARGLSRKENPLLWLGNLLYLNYTRGQEKHTPRLQALMEVLHSKYNGQAPAWFRESFCRESLPLMKYANILSFNTRSIVLFLALLVDLPWLYFVFELTLMNLLLVYMVAKHEHFCTTFTEQLNNQPKETCST
jgi:hypothetical protein